MIASIFTFQFSQCITEKKMYRDQNVKVIIFINILLIEIVVTTISYKEIRI